MSWGIDGVGLSEVDGAIIKGHGSTPNKGGRAEGTGEIMANLQPRTEQSLPGKT